MCCEIRFTSSVSISTPVHCSRKGGRFVSLFACAQSAMMTCSKVRVILEVCEIRAWISIFFFCKYYHSCKKVWLQTKWHINFLCISTCWTWISSRALSRIDELCYNLETSRVKWWKNAMVLLMTHLCIKIQGIEWDGTKKFTQHERKQLFYILKMYALAINFSRFANGAKQSSFAFVITNE